MHSPVEQLDQLKRGTAAIIPEQELLAKLAQGKKLRVKLGMDPTSPDLHLGHAVVLAKLKEFQDLGHEIIFIIGDFTALIGDPSGRSKTRPALTQAQIELNTRTYFEQVSRILDLKRMTIRYNSEWLGKLSMADFVALCGKVTLARIIEREDFANRMASQQPIGFHELLYPLMQGYDSVQIKADVELGGTDQTFNLLMGRFLQEHYGQRPQAIITTPLLEGLDGGPKMSKSLGNVIGLTESADQAYGKLMSISDTLMWHYMRVLLAQSDEHLKELQEQVEQGLRHPMDLKKNMAHAVVAKFWAPDQADSAQKQFEALFQKRDYESAHEVAIPELVPNPIWIVDLLKLLGAVQSSSEVKRLVEQKAILLEGKPLKDFREPVAWHSGMIIKVGKHKIYKIK